MNKEITAKVKVKAGCKIKLLVPAMGCVLSKNIV